MKKTKKRATAVRTRKPVRARPRQVVPARGRQARMVVQDVAGTTAFGGEIPAPIVTPPSPPETRDRPADASVAAAASEPDEREVAEQMG